MITFALFALAAGPSWKKRKNLFVGAIAIIPFWSHRKQTIKNLVMLVMVCFIECPSWIRRNLIYLHFDLAKKLVSVLRFTALKILARKTNFVWFLLAIKAPFTLKNLIRRMSLELNFGPGFSTSKNFQNFLEFVAVAISMACSFGPGLLPLWSPVPCQPWSGSLRFA